MGLGWARGNVTLEFAGTPYSTTADESGNWMVAMPPMRAGGPYIMTITASNQLTVSDILTGDVWLCSGQSNMELPVRRVKPLYEAEIAAAEDNSIRSFTVPKTFIFSGPYSDLTGVRLTLAAQKVAYGAQRL
jgi:sialate O-acetylesterase